MLGGVESGRVAVSMTYVKIRKCGMVESCVHRKRKNRVKFPPETVHGQRAGKYVGETWTQRGISVALVVAIRYLLYSTCFYGQKFHSSFFSLFFLLLRILSFVIRSDVCLGF